MLLPPYGEVLIEFTGKESLWVNDTELKVRYLPNNVCFATYADRALRLTPRGMLSKGWTLELEGCKVLEVPSLPPADGSPSSYRSPSSSKGIISSLLGAAQGGSHHPSGSSHTPLKLPDGSYAIDVSGCSIPSLSAGAGTTPQGRLRKSSVGWGGSFDDRGGRASIWKDDDETASNDDDGGRPNKDRGGGGKSGGGGLLPESGAFESDGAKSEGAVSSGRSDDHLYMSEERARRADEEMEAVEKFIKGVDINSDSREYAARSGAGESKSPVQDLFLRSDSKACHPSPLHDLTGSKGEHHPSSPSSSPLFSHSPSIAASDSKDREPPRRSDSGGSSSSSHGLPRGVELAHPCDDPLSPDAVFIAGIVVAGKYRVLGRFGDVQEASRVYENAKRKVGSRESSGREGNR